MTVTTKQVIRLLPAAPPHWVGDGFPVRSIFSAHAQDPSAISPFLLLDYAEPYRFAPVPGGRARGVDEHPHRGFETVTIVYQGELEHRDSAGNSGRVGPGDVQWMTAASGVVHEEKHSASLSQDGGTLEVVQLWVNLPAREKMAPPRYQEIAGRAIQSVALADEGGRVRVIAGVFDTTRGPARTVTPLNVWDVHVHPARDAELPVPVGHNTMAVLLRGSATISGTRMHQHQCALLDQAGEAVHLKAGEEGATLLLLSGEPIDEPVVAYGPFVMNTAEEIHQAIADYQSGLMGRIR